MKAYLILFIIFFTIQIRKITINTKKFDKNIDKEEKPMTWKEMHLNDRFTTDDCPDQDAVPTDTIDPIQSARNFKLCLYNNNKEKTDQCLYSLKHKNDSSFGKKYLRVKSEDNDPDYTPWFQFDPDLGLLTSHYPETDTSAAGQSIIFDKRNQTTSVYGAYQKPLIGVDDRHSEHTTDSKCVHTNSGQVFNFQPISGSWYCKEIDKHGRFEILHENNSFQVPNYQGSFGKGTIDYPTRSVVLYWIEGSLQNTDPWKGKISWNGHEITFETPYEMHWEKLLHRSTQTFNTDQYTNIWDYDNVCKMMKVDFVTDSRQWYLFGSWNPSAIVDHPHDKVPDNADSSQVSTAPFMEGTGEDKDAYSYYWYPNYDGWPTP